MSYLFTLALLITFLVLVLIAIFFIYRSAINDKKYYSHDDEIVDDNSNYTNY